MNRIFEPSGDHCADLSWAFEELVRLRVGPFSIGAVKTSPRATNSARSPLGLKLKDSMLAAAETREGRMASGSVGTVMGICFDWPLVMEQIFSSPPDS